MKICSIYNKVVAAAILVLPLLFASCGDDQDLVAPENLENIQAAKSTEMLLESYDWRFNDFLVVVNYPIKAIPLLANVVDQNGEVQSGTYDSYAIFGNDTRQQNYTYRFMQRTISRDSSGADNYQEIGSYLVMNGTQIGISLDQVSVDTYLYQISEDETEITFTADQLVSGRLNDAINRRITNSIATGKPSDIADAVVDKILGNPRIKAEIEQTLYDLINERISDLKQNRREVSEKIAAAVYERLTRIDWETLVYQKVLEILQELELPDAEQRAQQLAVRIARRIENMLSEQVIYDAILPIFEKFQNETIPELIPKVADAIFDVIDTIFSEENIYDKIYPIWTTFAGIDPDVIEQIADIWGAALTSKFFDADQLTVELIPFVQTLRDTPTVKLSQLAQSIIDDTLKPLVDQINARFPGMEISPNWNKVKTTLTSALAVIKPKLNGLSDEEAAAQLAAAVIEVMEVLVTRGVNRSLSALQEIPANEASSIIAAWIANLVDLAEPQIVAVLQEKLTELAEQFNAEEIAGELASQIHERIMTVFSVDNIYDLILPFVEQITSTVSVENAAERITDWLFELAVTKSDLIEDEVKRAIAGRISSLIGAINVDQTTQRVVDAILQSNVVEGIDGNTLRVLIQLKTYELLLELGNYVNAIEKKEISLIRR